MKISIEWTQRAYYLKAVFFFLIFLLGTFVFYFSHSWTISGIVSVVATFGLACLEILWSVRALKKT